ncbi:VCBS repeat-containing protein [Trichocoleus sp. FACHB-90]|uniref:FG-GAP-like repeat-containing protein n=1 Tax=Cyanophyceae TaxID=3028117 RepID=UPI0016822645|nr:FG-GAP-like repeat-containing protein [Trichocoleus sp. FACHB-90]MBD1929708.1 VCBS repeat-containing protein [Trichocoleus sp. FACHB-90]
MDNHDFLQLVTANSSLPISGQQQGNLFLSGLLQPFDTNLNQTGSFSNQTKAVIADIEIKPVEYDHYFKENILGNSTSELGLSITNSEFTISSDYSDPLTGDVTSVSGEALLNLATATAKEQLESFASDEEFIDKMNLAFGDDWQPEEANALIENLVSGEAIPKIEIVPAANLKANGAFGEDTIYLSEEFLTKNVANPEAVAGVLLEEIGHYVDRELNSVDSSGDEGDIFARLVQGETIAGAELAALKTENDSATIFLNGKEFLVELAGDPTVLVPIPSDFNGVPINEGLTSPSVEFMEGLLGIPGELDGECEGMDGVTDPELRQLMVTQNVGPFELTGLKPVVDAVQRIIDKVEVENPELYGQLTEAGMLCVRAKRTVEGELLDEFSNHSWGTAIDIRIGNFAYDLEADGQTYQGLVDLYPYFKAEGFYWGAAFQNNEDPPHFEASQELLERWEAEGILTPGAEPPPTSPPRPSTPPYQDYIVHEGTPIGVNPAATQFLTGDYDGDGKSDLFSIVTQETGTNSTEVHVLSGASNYQNWIVHEGTPIGVNPAATQFLTGDYDGDGKSDLFSIVTQETGTNSTEVHVLSGASNYQNWRVHEGTPIGVNPAATQFLTGDYDGDGKSDLFSIVTEGTGTNSTEVHVLSAASNYQDYIVHEGTPIGVNPVATQFLTGDYDGDGKSDLFSIVTQGTGTNSTEVHVLSGASNYQDWIVHEGTPIGVNPVATQFLTGDYDGDGRSDLFSVVTAGTGSNSTEVHVLSDGINDTIAVPPPAGSTSYDVTEIINSSAVDPEIREYAETSVPLILSEAEESGVTDPGQIAYILASADHESLLGRYLEELASGEEYEGREDLGNTEPGDGPRFKGRGYVQITGRANYTNWSERLGVDLVGNPELAADPEIAATILVEGMRDGSFTGVGLSDYISGENRDFVNARQIVNGVDKAEEIAQDAERYYQVLTT